MYTDLKQRTFNYALDVARLIAKHPFSIVNRPYFIQLINSSSSVGANYRASQRAKSTRDFINKLKIVEEETDESIFFLELLYELNGDHQNYIKPLIDEGTEILKIIVTSIKTARKKLPPSKKP